MTEKDVVARRVPCVGVELAQRGRDCQPGGHRSEAGPVVDEDMNAAALLALMGARDGRELHRHEADAGEAFGCEDRGEAAAVEPRCADPLERSIGAAAD